MSLQDERSPLLNCADKSNRQMSSQNSTRESAESSSSPNSTLDGRHRTSLPQHIVEQMGSRVEAAGSASTARPASPQPKRSTNDSLGDPGRRRSLTPLITVSVDTVTPSEARSEIERFRPRAQAIKSTGEGSPHERAASPLAADKTFVRVRTESPLSPKLRTPDSPRSPKTSGSYERAQISAVKTGDEFQTNDSNSPAIRDTLTQPPDSPFPSPSPSPVPDTRQHSAVAHYDVKHQHKRKHVRIALPPAPSPFIECGRPATRTDRVHTVVGASSAPGDSINDSGVGENEPLLGADRGDGGEQADEKEPEFVVYSWRWYMLVVLAALTALASADWILFAPIADNVASFMDVSPDKVNYLSLVFFVTMLLLPYTFLCAHLLERYGLRLAFWLAGLLLVIGSAIRLLALVPDLFSFDPSTTTTTTSSPSKAALNSTSISTTSYPLSTRGGLSMLAEVCGWLSQHRFASVLVGQTIIALSQPFSLFSSTKLASAWFPDDQRAFANMVATLSQVLGVMGGSLLAPILVDTATDVGLVLFVFGIPSLPLMIAIAFGVTASLPPTPPAPSAAAALATPASLSSANTAGSGGKSASSTGADAEEEGEAGEGGAARTSLWAAVKYAFTCPQFLIILVSFGICTGAFNAYTTLAAQILCLNGYSDRFTGFAITLQMAAGLLGGVAVTFYVDRSKRYIETVKVAAALGLVANALLMNLVLHPGFEGPILATVIFAGVVGLSVGPLFLELGIEATYPHVGEVLNNTLLLVFAQVFSVLFLVVAPWLGRPATDAQVAHSVCAHHSQQVDYTWTNVFFLFSSGLPSLLVVGCFSTELRRLAFDRAPRFHVRTRSVSVSFRAGRDISERRKQRTRAATIAATSLPDSSLANAVPGAVQPLRTSEDLQPPRYSSESET